MKTKKKLGSYRMVSENYYNYEKIKYILFKSQSVIWNERILRIILSIIISYMPCYYYCTHVKLNAPNRLVLRPV